MQMFRVEARKYSLRWGLAAGTLMELAVLVAWAVKGRMPISTHVLTTVHSAYHFPAVVPRLFDGLGIIIPVTLWVYLLFSSESRLQIWTKGKVNNNHAEDPFFWGLLIGACGLVLVTPTGFGGLLTATPIVLLIFALCWGNKVHWYQLVVCSIITILVIWTGETIILGAAPATIYALTIALVAAVLVAVVKAAVYLGIRVVYAIVGGCEYAIFTYLLPEKFRPKDGLLFDGYIEHRRQRAEAKHARANASKAA